MRIGGLASGMDTEQIIRDLMRAERMKGDKLIQNRTTLEWQRDSYREKNVKMMGLRDSFRATGLGLQSTFLQKTVTSSNDRIVTAVAGTNTPNTSVRMEVGRLASASSFVSGGIDQTKTKETLGDWEGIAFDEDGIAEFKMNVVLPGGEEKQVSFELSRDDTIQSAITKMNREGLGFQAFLDQNARTNQPQVVVTMSETGAGSSIYFGDEISTETNNAKELFTHFGFHFREEVKNAEEELVVSALAYGPPGDPNSDPDNPNNPRVGKNAVFTINGHETERTTNNFTINGVTYSLNGVTGQNETVTITSQTNTEKIMQDIMKFVEDYNELVDMVNGALREDRFRDFRPLTDEQKEAMSDKEIEMWEEKARSGLLRNDATLRNTLTEMRMAMFSGISDEDPDRILKDLSAFGLVTSPDYMDGGKIIIDTSMRTLPNGERMNGEDRMRYYIENHGESVYQLFMGNSDERSEQGVLRRLRGTLESGINTITERAGRQGRTNQQFTIGRQLVNLEDRISNFERRMQQTEERYWRQFSAMEKAMAELNSQADQIWSMLMPQQN
ncbi:flagellar hook-associated protein 2 [Evansella sp. AB-rgal1]|uniref:flagellar hook-associated protein 2 n=1 Tax=Evansella sp. AB-rgal1 TaxID=3242696 RepID=UPI00359D15A7